MDSSQAIPYQGDLFALFPGAQGGRSLAALRGREYFRTLGSRGGCTTATRYGQAHMRQLASAGGREKRRRLYTHPATIVAWDGVTYRRIPYWPARSSRRRRRPVFVRVEVAP